MMYLLMSGNDKKKMQKQNMLKVAFQASVKLLPSRIVLYCILEIGFKLEVLW